ncbi:mediator of RNA polymerase II transcription subunit 24 isoform X2 [Teleopsis dalmanni]|uniref:mediator of RNA polymerase II transcription subunit 24 isoform X2 n=1 Tax=Teleopsis dalmanni TaxID=139649 RepID=UPI0018CDB68A|nr:mediator of RNA polymerase II transcription subunit 24 isoform X2 [Teleopsis dalmanni]
MLSSYRVDNRKGITNMDTWVKVLPRGASGDVYNLADCIFQQAVIGSTVNPMILNYLRHSLNAHLVSHAAVLRRISKYEHFYRTFCVCSLLDFLDEIIDGVTCRNKAEEAVLPSAIVALVYWLVQIFAHALKEHSIKPDGKSENSYVIDVSSVVIEKLAKNQFLMGMLYIGSRQEDSEYYIKIRDKYIQIKSAFANSNYSPQNAITEKYLQQLAYIDLIHLEMPHLESGVVESITYCVQPLLAVEVLLNPCNDTSYYVAELQMIQRLKGLSNRRLFYEIIRAGFISLSNVGETSHDTMWGSFTFFKLPHIIKHLSALTRSPGEQTPLDFIPEVVEAFEMLLEDNLLLDFMDTKCSCNIIEYLLNDWTKQHLVNDMHVRHFSSQREMMLQKRESVNKPPSIINFIIRAEVPLSGILKTLSTDYNKVQEAVLGVLCQVLVGNSFELILSVATVEGRLKLFVSRLIQCNENSKQVPGEVGKPSVIRSTLFDVTFLMLTFIVQTYGSDVVLSENGDSFFEKWVRECMVERNKPKNPKNLVALGDDSIIEELLLNLRQNESQYKPSNLTWQDICMNLPAALHHVLVAWEKESISSSDVKNILENIKRSLFSFSVCATSFLCAYMYSVRETEFLKPLNMIQQFLNPNNEEISSQDTAKERLGLSFQIIRKMQHDVHPSGNLKSRSISLTHSLVSQTPLIDQFREVWASVTECGWLPVRATQILDSLLQAGGPTWIATKLVEEVLKCKYTTDMMKTMDIVFATFHLDIESITDALFKNVIPAMILTRQGDSINEPQSFVLARLCVYCVISTLETRQINAITPKKRSRSHDSEETDMVNNPKMRKIATEGSDNSCSNDFINDNHLLLNASANLKENLTTLKEPLNSSVQHIFKVFQQFVSSEEISPKTYFVYQFLSLLVECGRERVRPVLKLIPANLIQNLLKVMKTDDLSVGLITRLYDLRVNTGRQAAVSDLCLWRNLKAQKLNRQYEY